MVRHEASGSRTLSLVLLVLTLAGGVVASGCGSGGGGSSSDGQLCNQCGDTDGPCRPTVTVSGPDAQALCPAGQTSCDVHLACFRKLDSAQRRCFPNDGDLASQQFRCDGERANRNTPTRTPTPVLTPTPTLTPAPTITVTFTPGGGQLTATPTITITPAVTVSLTPTPTATRTPIPTQVCGNGVVEGDEECDGTDLDGEDCASFCFDATGPLSCTSSCTFDTSACVGDCS